MTRSLASAFLLGLVCSLGLVGCGEESKVTESEKVTTPEGSKTTTSETKVEATGDAKADLPK